MKNESIEEQSFGPSPYFTFGALLTSPFFWCAVVAAIFHHSIAARSLLWQAGSSIGLGKQTLAMLRWMLEQKIPLYAYLTALAFFHAYLRFLTTDYRVASNGDLVISTGLFAIFGPRGPFVVFEDGISASLVTDVNVTRNPIQMIFGTGTLILSYIELVGSHRVSRSKRVSFVNDPDQKAAMIRDRAGVRNARFWM